MDFDRLQRRSRKSLVDIAHDCLGLVQDETVMLERRYPAESVAREVCLGAEFARPHTYQLVGYALLGKREPHAPYIGAQCRAIDDRSRHYASPCRKSSGRDMSAGLPAVKRLRDAA